MFRLSSVFFTNYCPYCGELIEITKEECDECRSKFPDHSVKKQLVSGEICVAPFDYEGQARDAILNLKFDSARFNTYSLAKNMLRSFNEFYESERIDIITAVPMSKKARRERGYNQAELLAREISKLMGKPFARLLKKIKNNRIQHELDREERIKNVVGVYSAINTELFIGRTVLLVDDICTTGSTLSECCKELKKGGASTIICLTAAITLAQPTLPS